MEQNQINLTTLDKLLDDLAENGWAVSDNILSQKFCQNLALECQKIYSEGEFQKASIGHKSSKTINASIRGDFTFWLTENSSSLIQNEFWNTLSIIQNSLNSTFFLGLKRFETHFALYPPHAGYDKHVDNHLGLNNRKITFVLYLNPQWQPGDGGELSVYAPNDETKLLTTVSPKLGTLILFRSELFPHQVEKSHKERMSLTGWFRNDIL